MSTPELNFTRPAELIAAVPHLLGYVPVDSFVAVMLGHAEHPDKFPLRAAICGSINISAEQARRFPATCNLAAEMFPAAVLVGVYQRFHNEHAALVLDLIRTALHARGISVARILTTPSLAEPGTWVDLDTEASGRTIRYVESAATALGVARGHVIAPSRNAIVAEFAVAEAAPELDAEAQDIPALIAPTAHDFHRVITGAGDPEPGLAARATLLVTAHTGLRDGLLRLAVGHELRAARLWTHLAAQQRGTARRRTAHPRRDHLLRRRGHRARRDRAHPRRHRRTRHRQRRATADRDDLGGTAIRAGPLVLAWPVGSATPSPRPPTVAVDTCRQLHAGPNRHPSVSASE